MIAERASLKIELKKKNSIVEDAVSTITELRNELQSAEDDAETTINEVVAQLKSEQALNGTLKERNKKLMEETAKSTAVHTAQMNSLEKGLSCLLCVCVVVFLCVLLNLRVVWLFANVFDSVQRLYVGNRSIETYHREHGVRCGDLERNDCHGPTRQQFVEKS